MERRDVKILTDEEIRIIVNALGYIATLEHSIPEEIATIRKIIRTLEEQTPKKNEFNGTPNKILSDIWLVRRQP